MSKPTSTISRNLPEFPYTPAPAARKPLSALLSRSQFVTTVVSPASAFNPPSPIYPSSSDLADHPPEPAYFFSAQASPIPSSPSQTFPPSPAPAELLSARIESSILQSSRQASRQPSRSRSVKHPPPRAAEISKRPSSSRATRRLQSSKRSSSPSPSFTEASRPALIESGDRGSLTAHHRRRSSWRRLKKMGNRIVTPFQRMGVCITGGRAFSGDRSAGVSSTGSSCYSSGFHGSPGKLHWPSQLISEVYLYISS